MSLPTITIKDWIERASKSTVADQNGFFRAVDLYVNKPHVVNRRICGAKIVSEISAENIQGTFDQLFVYFEGKREFLKDLLNDCMKNISNNVQVILQDLFPRQSEKHKTVRQLVIIDKTNNTASFIPVCYMKEDETGATDTTDEYQMTGDLSYQFSLTENHTNNNIVLKTRGGSDELHGAQLSVKWLTEHLLVKLAKWSEETDLKTENSSLKLVCVQKYSVLYQQLKVKYGQELVKIWPEKTDPYKFVYEDVAIATYLILLWEQERVTKNLTEKQSFVDLGCGNGLLVYILCSEGYKGLGLDVRKRKIWSLYPPHTILKESPVTPSENNIFPEYDWLIGNHSDELTPWIPVMAARSSYSHRYFVLPCCHYDFDSKFSQRVSGTSQYRTYLDFVKEVGHKCGFEVQEDTLRIPSTKRVCFIGQTRWYTKEQETEMDKSRSQFIQSRCKKKLITSNQTESKEECSTDAHTHSVDFTARSNVEKVRNCSQLSRDLTSQMIEKVFEAVLNAESAEKVACDSGKTWNRGGSLSLGEVASLFDKNTLQQLKTECGGLQTLLRNHHQIFLVSGGEVKLRYLSDEPVRKKKKAKMDPEAAEKFWKTKLCWFNCNHPDGCPLQGQNCKYAHGDQELRKMENPKVKQSIQ